jgi:ankyrin repeat protein
MTDILAYILPLVSPSLLSAQNSSGSTPLHWAALNEQLDVMKVLVAHPTGPGPKLVDIKNNAGRTPLGEAEMAGWDAGAAWLVSVMDINESKRGTAGTEEAELTDEVVGDADVEGTEPLEIHVEVHDAEGGISRRTVNAYSTQVSGNSRTSGSSPSEVGPA